MKLPAKDKAVTISRYSARYREFGYSPKSLGWNKGKQDIRFEILTSQYNCAGKTILDIGCGFGDLNIILKKKYDENYRYVGVDLVPELLTEARVRFPSPFIHFIEGDFLDVSLSDKPDFAIASGVFNYKLEDGDNYSLIEATIEKAFEVCKDGLAFDFLSDKVDYPLEHTFHSSPEKILALAYRFSRNVVIRSDYMPFEFSIFIFKDDSFSKEDTVFQRYKSLYK